MFKLCATPMTYFPAVRWGHKPQLLKLYSFLTDHSRYMLADTINMLNVEINHLNTNYHPKAEKFVLPNINLCNFWIYGTGKHVFHHFYYELKSYAHSILIFIFLKFFVLSNIHNFFPTTCSVLGEWDEWVHYKVCNNFHSTNVITF